MSKKIWAIILQIPAWILMIALFIGFIIASMKGYGGVSGKTFFKYAVPVWIILALYLVGRILGSRAKDNFPSF